MKDTNQPPQSGEEWDERFWVELSNYWKLFWFNRSMWTVELLSAEKGASYDSAIFWQQVNILQLERAEGLKNFIAQEKARSFEQGKQEGIKFANQTKDGK